MIAPRRIWQVACWALVLCASTAHAQVKLEWKHPEGMKETLEHTFKLAQTTTVMGMEIETSVEQVSTSTNSIGTKRADGTVPVETMVNTLKATVNAAGMGFSFDSTDSAAKEPEEPQLRAAFAALKARVGTSYTVVLDKDGKVSAVEGLEKLLDQIQEKSPEAAEQVKAQLNVETVKRSESQHLDRIPDTLLRPGESWTRTEVQDLGSGQILTYEQHLEYVGTIEKEGKKLDKISLKTTNARFSISPNATLPAKVTSNDLKVGESNGTILFDREAGRIVESNEKVQIKGPLTLEIQGNELELQIDLTIEDSNVYKKAA
jgi:hypothetical protein